MILKHKTFECTSPLSLSAGSPNPDLIPDRRKRSQTKSLWIIAPVLFQIDGTEVTTDEKETHKSLTYKITFRKKSILDKLSKILNSNLFFFFKNISALENQIPIFYICVHQNLFTGY